MKGFKFYASAALLSVLVTTSCVDDTESDTISALRQAKVEYMKSQTALEMANVALANAETALLVQQAKFEEALLTNTLIQWENDNEQAKIALEIAQRQNEKAELEHKQLMEGLLINNPTLKQAIVDYRTYIEQSNEYAATILSSKITITQLEGILALTEKSNKVQVELLKETHLQSINKNNRALNASKSQLALYESVENFEDLKAAKDAKSKAHTLKNTECEDATSKAAVAADDYTLAQINYNDADGTTLGQIIAEIARKTIEITEAKASVVSITADIKAKDLQLSTLNATVIKAEKDFSISASATQKLYEAYQVAAAPDSEATPEEITDAYNAYNVSAKATAKLDVVRSTAEKAYSDLEREINALQGDLSSERANQASLEASVLELNKQKELYTDGEINSNDILYKAMIAAKDIKDAADKTVADLTAEVNNLQKELTALESVTLINDLGVSVDVKIDDLKGLSEESRKAIIKKEVEIANLEISHQKSLNGVANSINVLNASITVEKEVIALKETEKAYADAMAATQKEYIDSQAK